MRPLVRITAIIATPLVAFAAACGSGSHPAATPATASPSPSPDANQIRSGIPTGVATFHVTSPDVRDGQSFPADELANSFGCTGGGHAPRLQWTAAPTGTRSFAVTMFDPDAPTGNGFWHWLAWDIPATAGAAPDAVATAAVAGTGDAGTTGYQGPCPPTGDPAHHYRITVLALDVPTLGLPAATPPALATFSMYSHIIGYARMVVTAQR
ncbi:YbhB/YbcL family Raf kinase inhibitor-like protein [Nocardia sp. alder85J]|uniref:YbhB/YbcL family Raf kinase inhibitor-like protein n=1 Tax=Nocardia sp. alder85J TaxID=2862949 RepID=UPI001CD6FF3E|nr:YbhB/YbcL family Raf kinase inhibitor-like protein [Nocardia sp. alder85J]MCX4097565.1 YbhB/YbcL family Raf kinase inhibitor-like protein [Nocardia sp. alder85J]